MSQLCLGTLVFLYPMKTPEQISEDHFLCNFPSKLQSVMNLQYDIPLSALVGWIHDEC